MSEFVESAGEEIRPAHNTSREWTPPPTSLINTVLVSTEIDAEVFAPHAPEIDAPTGASPRRGTGRRGLTCSPPASTEAPSFSIADLEPMMYNELQVLAKRHGILHGQSGQALRDALGALVESAGPSTEIPGQPMIHQLLKRDHIAEAAAELASMEAGELQP